MSLDEELRATGLDSKFEVTFVVECHRNVLSRLPHQVFYWALITISPNYPTIP